jgi:hypothetical protein
MTEVQASCGAGLSSASKSAAAAYWTEHVATHQPLAARCRDSICGDSGGISPGRHSAHVAGVAGRRQGGYLPSHGQPRDRPDPRASPETGHRMPALPALGSKLDPYRVALRLHGCDSTEETHPGDSKVVNGRARKLELEARSVRSSGRPGEPVSQVVRESAQVWAERGQLGEDPGRGQVPDADTGVIPPRVRPGDPDVGQGRLGHASNSNDGSVRQRRDTRTAILCVSL